VKILSTIFDLSQIEEEELKQIAEYTWKSRQYLFGTNTSYENVLLGITLKVIEDNRNYDETIYGNSSEKILSFLEKMNKEYFEKNRISVYNVYQTVKELFPNDSINESIEDILIQSFDFTQSQKERLILIWEDLCSKKIDQIENMHPDNVLLGALIYVYEKSNHSMDFNKLPLDLMSLIKAFHEKDHEKHLDEVNNAHQIVLERYSSK
jgi:hypothetical protein